MNRRDIEPCEHVEEYFARKGDKENEVMIEKRQHGECEEERDHENEGHDCKEEGRDCEKEQCNQSRERYAEYYFHEGDVDEKRHLNHHEGSFFDEEWHGCIKAEEHHRTLDREESPDHSHCHDANFSEERRRRHCGRI